ncbi:MAG: hypothetical protein FJ096_00195 [Deltaproteobacteria bacterium]|nr:hypothetical protein [Deltaproteobacteria bacterium]
MTIQRAAGFMMPALLCACWQVTRPSLPVVVEEAEPVAVVEAAPIAEDGPPLEEESVLEEPLRASPLAVAPALTVSEVSGLSPSLAGALLAPAAEALAACKTTSTGKLVLRLIAEPGSTHVRVVDEKGLDVGTNRCALSALGTFEVDESIQQSWSQSDAVRRVETQLILSW